jgi:hypothetical protein
MDIKAFSYTGINGQLASRLSNQRAKLADLTTQETTGLKSSTYKGIENRTLTLSCQSKIAQINGYKSTIAAIDTRLQLIGNSIDSMNDLSHTLSSNLGTNGYQLTSSGKTSEQIAAGNALDGYVSTLNTEIDGTYLFAGKASNSSPVVDSNTMINGDGTRAGFKQVMEERLQADLGSDGLGRLALSSSGSTVTLAEDGSHPFGMKLATATSTLAGATVTGPTGTPASLSVAFASQPASGQKLELTMTQPDGTKTSITLTAGDANDTTKGTFAIGATAADTAANLQTVMQARLETVAKTDTTAASASAAANNFFDTAGGASPMRVAGTSPFYNATSLVAGTSANTVTWYRGTNDANTPRLDAEARVGEGLSINYGVRANESAFTSQIKQLAIVSTMDVSDGDDTAKALWSSVVDRTKGPLAATTGSDTLQSVAAEISGARKTASSASDRMTIAATTYQDTVDKSLNVDDTELAVQITTLNTQIEASYKASSILYKLSLTNYL